MSRLNNVITLRDNFGKMFEEFYDKINVDINEIKKEHKIILLNNKNELLNKISKDYDIDLVELQNKYLTEKELSFLNNVDSLHKKSSEMQGNILDVIIINDTKYYYEPISNGKVYDNKSKIVGYYRNEKVELLIN